MPAAIAATVRDERDQARMADERAPLRGRREGHRGTYA
jgi:hypothetical protein